MADRLFLSCDWGMSRFRLRLVDVASGAVLGESQSAEGVGSLAASNSLATSSASETRDEVFRSVLHRHVGPLLGGAGGDGEGPPVLISGMAGSSIGWRDVPYVPLPFVLDGRDVAWQNVGSLGNGPRPSSVFLLSGARSDNNVMRGEEIEAIGIGQLPAGRQWLEDAVLILPGTHSKHIRTVGGRIIAFETHMTGELFSLLGRHSSLQHSVQNSIQHSIQTQGNGPNDAVLLDAVSLDEALPDAFRDGVAYGRANPLSSALFQVRVRQVLHALDAASSTALLSGLLIGAEIAALAHKWPGDCPIILCANRKLCRLYQTALETLGLSDRLTVVSSADVDRLSVLGQAVVLDRIESQSTATHTRLRAEGTKEIGGPAVRRVFDWKRFRSLPVVGILRGFTCQEAESLVHAAAAEGLLNVEVTMNSPDAVGQLRRLCERFGDRLNVGAGTVCTLEDLRTAFEAGATFIITPAVVREVIAAGVAIGLPVFAGAATPSEILQAWQLGASIVKVFPADQLGPAFIRSVKGPLPQVRLMPVGGVTVDSISAYKLAGAEAFGIGSPLFSKSHASAGDWQWVSDQMRRFRQAWTHSDTVDTAIHVVAGSHEALLGERPAKSLCVEQID